MKLHVLQHEDGSGPEAEPDTAAASRWVSAKPRSIRGSLGGALLLEAALVAGLLIWLGHRSSPSPVTERVAVRMVQPTVPPKPAPVTPTQVRRPEMPVVAELPVIAQSSPLPVPTEAFSVPAVVQPSAPPAAGTPAADPLQRYTAELNAAVQAGLRVTGMVRAMRLHGVASVMFRLTPAGQLLWAKLARSSGIPPIDEAALARVRMTVYPPFPADIPQHDLTFQIEVKLSAGR